MVFEFQGGQRLQDRPFVTTDIASDLEGRRDENAFGDAPLSIAADAKDDYAIVLWRHPAFRLESSVTLLTKVLHD